MTTIGTVFGVYGMKAPTGAEVGMMAEAMAEDREFVAFVEDYWDRYLRLARLLTGNSHLGEELLQDTLVRLYVRWRRLSDRDPHAYVRRMLVNGNVSWWRRRRREQLVESPPGDRSDEQPQAA